MHVMHVIDSLAPGGAERLLVDLANVTAEHGHKVSVYITRSRQDLAAELSPTVTLFILGRTSRFDFARLLEFCRNTRLLNPDIIHVHGRSSFSLVAVLKLFRLIGTRPLVLLHDHYGIEIDAHIPIWFRLLGPIYVNAYVGVYEKLGDWAASANIPKQRITIIQNALRLARLGQIPAVDLRTEYNIPATIPIGILVGGIRAEKGIELLLAALSAQQSPFQFFIVGGDADPLYAHECRTMVKSMGLTDRVHFLGSRNDVPGLLQGSDFAVISSRSESGPLVLIEYLAIGLPFAAFEVGGISKQVARLGIAGFVAPNDAEGLADAIGTLLSLTAEERRERGRQGRVLANTQFELNEVFRQWTSVYNTLLT